MQAAWRIALLSVAMAGLFALAGCGYVRARVTVPPSSPTPTGEVRLVAPSWRATSTPIPSTPLPTATATPTPTPIVHVVQEGDLLIHIASEYDVPMQDIIEVNGITRPDSLPIGMRLIIPRSEEEVQALLPTSTPTPMPLDVVHVGLYRTLAGSVWCMGEVENANEQALDLIQLRVSLYNTGGQLLDQSDAFALADVVPAQGTAPFAVLLSGQSAERFASYRIEVLGAEPIEAWGGRHRSLVVEEVQGEDDHDQYVVQGIVRNEGDVGARAIRVTIVAYAGDGAVVAVRQVDLDPLAAQEQRPFTATLIPAAPAASVRAIAWGMVQAE